MGTLKILRTAALPLLCAAVLVSCGKDDNIIDTRPDINGPNGDISFTIDFAPQTRVSTGADFKSEWEDGDKIGLFAVAHDGTGGALAVSGNYITNVALTYNGASGTWTPSEPIWWPGGGKVLSFYAFYPYLPVVGFDPTAISFSVMTDQNSTIGGMSNYNQCDLVTARSDNAGNGWGKGSTVPLTFNHALAMVQVSVPSGGKGFGPSENLKVTLRGVKRLGTLNLANVSATPGSEITLPATGNDATHIIMHRVEQPADVNYETSYTYRALVPAQSVAAGSSLFWFEHEERQLLTDGALAQALQMTAGQAETFTRTLPATLVHTVSVAAGTFYMGSPPAELYRGSDETRHSVTLTKDFRMSKYQVTNAQYAAFLNATGIGSNGEGSVIYNYDSFTSTVMENRTLISENIWGVIYDGSVWKAQPGYENYPVINVSWFGAKAYADWVGGYLPTEAQWEYACRAGTATAFYFGDDAGAMGDYGWYNNNSSGGTKPVGQKRANAYGLYDMHGNVFEWCSDWYDDNYGSASAADAATDPPGVAAGSRRVLRGGSWATAARYCRSACRTYIIPDGADINSDIGFRVVFAP